MSMVMISQESKRICFKGTLPPHYPNASISSSGRWPVNALLTEEGGSVRQHSIRIIFTRSCKCRDCSQPREDRLIDLQCLLVGEGAQWGPKSLQNTTSSFFTFVSNHNYLHSLDHRRTAEFAARHHGFRRCG